MQMMDVRLLKDALAEQIENIHVGLHWKMISLGSQGAIPKEHQVKAMHVLVDKLDATMTKPLPHNFVYKQSGDRSPFSAPYLDAACSRDGCHLGHKRLAKH